MLMRTYNYRISSVSIRSSKSNFRNRRNKNNNNNDENEPDEKKISNPNTHEEIDWPVQFWIERPRSYLLWLVFFFTRLLSCLSALGVRWLVSSWIVQSRRSEKWFSHCWGCTTSARTVWVHRIEPRQLVGRVEESKKAALLMRRTRIPRDE